MAIGFDYLLTFAGLPFVTDDGMVFRMDHDNSAEQPFRDKATSAPRIHQPESEFLDELMRLTNLSYLQDFALPTHPARKLASLAHQPYMGPHPSPEELRIGDWYYPTGARRWSVFRGLTTSKIVKEMLALTRGVLSATLTMRAVPRGAPENAKRSDYTISSFMFMLPPRPLFEGKGLNDGLFLVTLVDERYYWKDYPFTATIRQNTTWSQLVTEISDRLSLLSNNFAIQHETIPDSLTRPEPDSAFWSQEDSIASVLDAVCINVGMTLVRNLDGTYNMVTPGTSRATARLNRQRAKHLKIAGGDLGEGDANMPAGNRVPALNAVYPAAVRVTFPTYMTHDAPVPHFLNRRYANQRPSSWIEEVTAPVTYVEVPISSGGETVSGQTGSSTLVVHDSAKALYSGTDTLSTLVPYNLSGLTAMAMQIALDVYETFTDIVMDETYPGTLLWTPEGAHDLVWTYSPAKRIACTRVLRTEWNNHAQERQHATPVLSGMTSCLRGVGGKSVAQTWRDQYSGAVTTQLNDALTSGAASASLLAIGNLPTQNRWRGLIDGERIQFQGTSGGTTVGIVARGVDGSVQLPHNSGATVTLINPNTVYGANLVTFEKGQYVYPGDWLEGIQEVRVVPQTQTIEVLNNVAITINGVAHYSGQLMLYDPSTAAPQYAGREYVWVVDRNGSVPRTGIRYDGQFIGHSASGAHVAPVYLVNETSGITAGGATLTSGSVQWFYLASGAVRSGHLTSGAVQSGTLQWYHFGSCISGILCSGSIYPEYLSSGVVQNYHLSSGSVYNYHLSSGSVIQTHLASGYKLLGSGAVTSGYIASGAIYSGLINSGIIYWYNFASGAVQSGHIASGAVSCDAIACRKMAQWVRVTVTFDDINDEATNVKSIVAYTLPAGGTILATRWYVTTLFAGATINAILFVNLDSTTQDYFGTTNFSISAVGGREWTPPGDQRPIESVVATTDIEATYQSIGGTLDNLTQGSMYIYFLVSVPDDFLVSVPDG